MTGVENINMCSYYIFGYKKVPFEISEFYISKTDCIPTCGLACLLVSFQSVKSFT